MELSAFTFDDVDRVVFGHFAPLDEFGKDLNEYNEMTSRYEVV